MGMDAAPGQAASDFLGGTGEVYAGRGSQLVGTLATLGVAHATINTFDGHKRAPMKPGDPVAPMLVGHVAVHAPQQKSGGLFDMIGSICEAATSIETLKPEQQAPTGPVTGLPAAKMENPKNSF